MEYVKHKYSKRVYRVMIDHGEGHPYLSCFPYVRYCEQSTIRNFFIPCSGPIQSSPINIPTEMEWEKNQLLRKEPLLVKAPSPVRARKALVTIKDKTTTSDESYTLSDLCREIGMDPSKARKLLRAKGKKPPEGVWKWPDRESARSIKRFLKKF